MKNRVGFLLFGYYDYLNIQRTSEWFDFSPVEKDAAAGQEETTQKVSADEKEVFSDSYPVKLLFPRKDCQKNMTDMGFCFNPWYNAGKFGGQDFGVSPPLISIVLLNVSNRFLAQYGTPAECLKAVARGIKKSAKMSGGFLSDGKFDEDKFRKLNCGLFQAIGSQDYVLLCLSDNWHDVFLLVDALHAWRVSPKKGEPYSAISNLYLVPGISAAGIDVRNMDTAEDDQILEAVVRLTLRSGESVQDFYRDFENNLNDYLQDSCREAEFSMLHGRYDAAVTFTAPVRKALPLLQSGGMLHPSNEFFKKHLVDTNSSIRLKIDRNDGDDGQGAVSGQGGKAPEVADRSESSDRIEAIETWVDETYEGFLKRTLQHTRQSKALRELIILLSNLNKSPHSNAICSILLDALESLQKNVDLLMARYDAGDAAGDAAEKRKCLTDINKGTDRFRDLVGNYLLSLAQAERLFIEGLRIRHQSVASATKLLFGYNRIIRTLAEITSRGQGYSYSFVVVSGGCDSTKAYNLFDCPVEKIGDAEVCENRLVVIQLSEMSIFNVPGTLFRLFHEAWHYCGDRLRPQRNGAWVESLSFALSYVLASAIFTETADLERLWEDCAAAGLHQLARRLYGLFVSEQKCYALAIRKSFREFLERNAPHLLGNTPAGEEIYREDYWDSMQAALFEWLCPDLDWGAGQSEGNAALLTHLIDHRAELLRKTLASIEQERVKPHAEEIDYLNTVPIEVLKGFLDAIRTQGETYEKAKRFVDLCTAILCRYRVKWEAFGRYSQDNEKNLSKHVALLRENHIIFLCRFISEAYKEAFSDYMACHTLRASATDYLLGLVYESWNLDKSFAIQHLPVLRIGSVLEALCCAPQTTDRSFERIWGAEEFEEKFDRLAKTSPRYRESLSVEEFKNRVSLIWAHYNTPLMQGISRPLVSYLRACSDAMDERIRRNGKWEELERIRDTFEKANAILSNDPMPVADGVNAILSYWIDLNCETDWGKGAAEE